MVRSLSTLYMFSLQFFHPFAGMNVPSNAVYPKVFESNKSREILKLMILILLWKFLYF